MQCRKQHPLLSRIRNGNSCRKKKNKKWEQGAKHGCQMTTIFSLVAIGCLQHQSSATATRVRNTRPSLSQMTTTDTTPQTPPKNTANNRGLGRDLGIWPPKNGKMPSKSKWPETVSSSLQPLSLSPSLRAISTSVAPTQTPWFKDSYGGRDIDPPRFY